MEKYKLIPHSYQIADTGDYDGCYEITNGAVSLFTKDDPEDGELEKIVDALNDSDCEFYLDDSVVFELHLEKKTNKNLQQSLQDKDKRIRELEEKNRWYTPEEKLPENTEKILFEPTFGGVNLGVFLSQDQWHRHDMFCDGSFHEKQSVKRWRYLPAPPTDNNQKDTTIQSKNLE